MGDDRAHRKEEYEGAQRFPGRPGDLFWGPYDYYVTRTQKTTLDSLKWLLIGLPHVFVDGDRSIPEGYFCSQRTSDGVVVFGLHKHSVEVHRNGRLTAPQKQ